MSYTARQIIETNERLIREYEEGLHTLLIGEASEVVIYKGPVTGLSHYHYFGFNSQVKMTANVKSL